MLKIFFSFVNSSLKSSIKSLRVNFLQNPSDNLNLPYLENVSNLPDCIYHKFGLLMNMV